MLVVEGLTCRFGAKAAVDDASFQISPGGFVGVIGRSGAGKSTLLRTINRLVTPTQGRILYDGIDVTALRGKELRQWRARSAMIFQQFNLVGRLSLFSNVALGLLGRIDPVRGFLGLWPGKEKTAIMAALQRVGLADYAGQRADSLSGGQQQRAAIARAMVQQAKAVFADEPVASLDPVAARKVMELLCELNRAEGIGVFISLHQVDYALRYCRRIIALKAGKVVYDGKPEGLDRARLVDIYGPEIENVFWEGAPQ